MNRRQFLSSSGSLAGGLAAWAVLPRIAIAEPAPTLAVSTRTLEVNGRAANVYHLSAGARPGLEFEAGAPFRVNLRNTLAEPTIVHWHGLIPPIDQDGVAGPAQPMLGPGESRAYDFPLHRPGTYWMHAHTLQHQNLLSAPLIVHGRDERREDIQEVVLMLHDFSFTPAAELLARLTGGSGHADHGMGSMDMGSMDMGSMDMSGMDMGNMDMASMDLNDINYDAYLANDRTLDDPEIVAVDKGGRVRLRIINAAASTAFTISTGVLPADLISVDGQPVTPLGGTSFPLTMGQRIDLVVTIPRDGGAFPVIAQREGAVERTGLVLATRGAPIARMAAKADAPGPVLDLSLENRLRAKQPLPVRPADKTFMVHLAGNMARYQWSLMDADSLSARSGERVEIALMNMSMMSHPMHLHGHHFQVVGIEGQRLSGALRDTVLVPPMKTVTIAFDAGGKGDWAFHCHHLYHMVSGMMARVQVT